MFMAPFTNLKQEMIKITAQEELFMILLNFLRRCHKSDDVLEGKPSHKNSLSNLKEIFLLCKSLNLYFWMEKCLILRDCILPVSSLTWNAGRVENIRHNVDTTTNRHETMATT